MRRGLRNLNPELGYDTAGNQGVSLAANSKLLGVNLINYWFDITRI